AIAVAATPKTSSVGMDHSHMPIAVPSDAPTPGLSLILTQDAVSGFNLTLDLERYALVVPPAEMDMATMMKPSQDAATGFVEGHAHLYVNGEKIRRLYGTREHLPGSIFRPGVNQVTVTLNNHGHMAWTVNEKKVLATLFVNPDAKPVIAHRFESFAAH
ncbi:MAG: hypothetical protein AAF658_19605, partial [Myxococcota bacterium]